MDKGETLDNATERIATESRYMMKTLSFIS